MSVSDSESTADGGVINWYAVGRGAAAGLCFLVLASVIEAILDRNIDSFSDSGWIYPLFVLILFGYMLAGFGAGRQVPQAALSNGLLAGIGAFALWIPVRIVIWAIRDSGKGLFGGVDPVFTPGRILGQIVFAAAFGAIGGWIASRRSARTGTSADA